MKTRSGFVSNSSASSFCILGIRLDKDESFNRDEFDDLSERAKSVGLEVGSPPDEYARYVVGISARKLPMDKTINEMITIISEKLKSIGIQFDKVTWH